MQVCHRLVVSLGVLVACGLAALGVAGSVAASPLAQTPPTPTPTPVELGPDFVLPLPPLEGSGGPPPVLDPETFQPATEPPPAEPPPPGPPGVQLWVAEPQLVLLRLEEDMGKEIKEVRPRTGRYNGARYAEVRFVRGFNRLGAGMGPIRVFNKVYMAPDLAVAQQIYQEEVQRQEDMPEAVERSTGIFLVEGVEQFGDEQNLHATCNTECEARDLDGAHWRVVVRNRNAVIVLYFFGGLDSATSIQMNQWLAKTRERLH